MLLKDINNMNVDKFRIYGFVILGDFWNIYWNNKKWYEKKNEIFILIYVYK